MFKSPYDTSAVQAYDVHEMQLEVERARVDGGLVTGLVDGFPNVLAIVSDNDNVPTLPHPLTFISKVDKTLCTVVDLRPYSSQLRKISDTRYEHPTSGPVPFNLMRAQLQHLWNITPTPDFSNLSPLPLAVFSHWVGDVVSSKLTLDPDSAVAVIVVAGLWFVSQYEFEDRRQLTDAELTAAAVKIKNGTGTPLQRVLDILTPWNQSIVSTEDFINAVKTCVASIRLERLNKGFLYTIIGGSWYATALAREVAGVALEYPPTFIAMVWSSVTERTYRNTPIGERTIRYGKNGLDKQFATTLGVVVGNSRG